MPLRAILTKATAIICFGWWYKLSSVLFVVFIEETQVEKSETITCFLRRKIKALFGSL